MSASTRSRGSARFNVGLAAVLLVVICVFANALAREHLGFRRDFSEDQLTSMSPATVRMLERLDDVLHVKAFFTGEARHGQVQVAKGRLVDQLRELQEASDGRMRVEFADPNASSEARLEAARYGIVGVPLESMSGTAVEVQQVWLGLLLRHRGRERVIPFVQPQRFEYAFAFELRQLLVDEPPTVGFLVTEGLQSDGSPFRTAREVLSISYRVVEVTGLAEGDSVPDEVRVLVVPRPVGLHAREVFEVDQYLQRGGRALFLLDRTQVDTRSGQVLALDPGLDGLFAAWGVALSGAQVWDQNNSTLTSTREVLVQGRTQQVRNRVPYPLWPAVDQDGLSAEVPATARLAGAQLFWAHAFALDEAPDGVERTPLLTSSPKSWLVPPLDAFQSDFEALNARSAELLASGGSGGHTLALAVSGKLPTPFLEAPAPRDPIVHARWLDQARVAAEEGRKAPPYPHAVTDEAVLDRADFAQVVLVGDSDWMSDGKFLSDSNRLLFQNLVDWLGLEEDLLAIRSRIPRTRTIRDFLEEERDERGLGGLGAEVNWEQAGQLTQREAEAQRAARNHHRLAMLGATGGSLVLAWIVGGLVRFLTRRPAFGREPTGGDAA